MSSLTVCTVWCTVHSPVLEWAEWGETTLGFLLCTLETGPYWALSQAAQLRTPGWVNVSDSDKVLGITVPSAAQCPGQPSLRAKSENVKLNDKIDRILCAQTAHKQLNVAEKVEKHHLELLDIFKTLLKSEWKGSFPSFVSCFDTVLSTFIFLQKCQNNNKSGFKDSNISNFQMIFIQHKR